MENLEETERFAGGLEEAVDKAMEGCSGMAVRRGGPAQHCFALG
jgi:hypothetical protein